MKITYSKYGDYYLPDLVLSEEEPATYGHLPHAAQVSEGAPPSDLYQFENLRSTDTSSQRNRPRSKRNATAANRADGASTRHHRAAKGRESDGVGRCDE